jgi:Holliday junction resolvasome RuvABC endonuclease subunit
MMYFGALDLARVTGACAGLPFERPEVETFTIPKGPIGERMTRMRRMVRRWAETHGPDLVFIEQPMDPAALVKVGATAETILSLNGYVAVVLGELHDLGIETMMLPRQSVLKHFVGRARFAKKDDGKRACAARCQQLGWPVANHDEADAVALWDYGCSLKAQREYLRHATQRAMR